MKQELEKRKYAYEMVIEELRILIPHLKKGSEELKRVTGISDTYESRLEEVDELIAFLPPEDKPWVITDGPMTFGHNMGVKPRGASPLYTNDVTPLSPEGKWEESWKN